MKAFIPAIAVAAASLATSIGWSADAPAHQRTAAEQKEVDRAIDFVENVIAKMKVEQFKDYVAPTFIEHHPGLDGNLAELEKYFTKIRASSPPPPPPDPSKPHDKVLFSFVEGDVVCLIVLRDVESDPKSGPDKYGRLGMEIIRFNKGGKQIEHWDEELALAPGALSTVADQPPPEPAAH